MGCIWAAHVICSQLRRALTLCVNYSTQVLTWNNIASYSYSSFQSCSKLRVLGDPLVISVSYLLSELVYSIYNHVSHDYIFDCGLK